ncbi:hypothetical protein MKC95_11355 [[Clostridium] innocuum]|uniref:DUF5050 domain-containing protein n=1 Tax=Clostridium innocuum TaxID=1522 RepID=A0AAP2UPA4_CLOIN|nr:hypothetical protein [[Clostridium] innocuum]
MIRYQGNKVKKYFYFLLVILFTANVFGCTKQIGNDSVTDRKIQEDGKESIYKRLYHIGEALCKYVPKEYSYFYNGEGTVRMQTFQMHKKILTGFDDSGSAHPTYANETYAWEYTKNSLKTAALFANYDYVTCDANQLVKTDANGKRTVIYQGNGYGNLWIVNERMYLYRNNSKENKERELFSLNMQGKDEHAYGDYEVHAVHDKYLVLTNSEETEIHVMDTETEDILLLETDAQYLYTDDDTVYFTEHPKDTDEHIVLASVKLDATERCRLADVRKEDVNQIIQTSTNLYINCVQVVKDKVYFSCGTYGGSASVYQGGVLAKVKKDGSNFKVLGEAPINFTVYETGEIMKYGRINKPYQDDNGNIWIYRNNAREKLIVNGEDYYRRSTVDEYVDIRNVDVQKDVVYFSVNYSVPDESVSIGWRTGYRLQSSVYYRKNLKTGISEKLYELQF